MEKRWAIAETLPAMAQSFAAELGLPPSLAGILVRRGIDSAAAAQRFLQPQLRHLGDPSLLQGVPAAVARLLTAIDQHQRIVIYGDYDVDGVTASALLARVLSRLGGRVANFVPHRVEEGYGLSPAGIARCLAQCQPQLLVAVDCGTCSVAEIAQLSQQGVDVVVCDHHEPPAQLPCCVALVNPKVSGQLETPLASVGVAFKLAHALLKARPAWQQLIDLREELDLVALGTVADLVPLVQENRLLVRSGLEWLGRTRKVGLRALLEVAQVPAVVTPYHVGFRLGPRLNAAGRLADAQAALELLLTEDAARARLLAQQLHQHNTERQQLEEQIVAAALAQAEPYRDNPVLVLADPAWHVGVIGIVAARVLQAFHRPTIVIGADGKGSCRSLAGFSMVGALEVCRAVLEQFGGHEMAAGLRIDLGRVGELRAAINAHARQMLRPEDLLPQVAIDAVLALAELDAEFFAVLEQFEPCGADNPAPVFAVRNVRVHGPPRVVGKQHLKFQVSDGTTSVDAIWFRAGDRVLPDGPIDIAFAAELNEFRGVTSPQLRVRDVRAAS